MFSLNRVTLTEDKINYFSNHSQLSKDFIKVLKLISYRENKLFYKVDNIKYNHIVHFIKKNINEKEINHETLKSFVQSFKSFLLAKLDLSNEITDEIILLFLFNIENKHKITIKQNLFNKIKLRVEKINDYCNKEIYREKRRNKQEKLEIEKLKKNINEEQDQEINQVFYNFNLNFKYYKDFINKKYNYVLKPDAFINYCEIFNNDFLKKYEKVLKNINMYQHIIDLKDFFEELAYIINMSLLSVDKSPQPSFYLQETNENAYIEIKSIAYEESASYHGGKKFAHMIIGKSPIYWLKEKEMREKFKNEMVLQKIVWDDALFLELRTYEKETDYFCDIDYDQITFLKTYFNDEKNVEEFKALAIYEVENIYEITTYAYFNNKKIDGDRLKGFFLFKSEKDYYEVQLLNNQNVILIKIKFFINKLEILNCVNNNIIVLKYNDFFKN